MKKIERKRRPIRKNLFEDSWGGFSMRVTIEGKRTWHKLDAKTLSFALLEYEKKNQAQDEAHDRGVDPLACLKDEKLSFGEMADLYLLEGCPNSTLKDRSKKQKFCQSEAARVKMLKGFYGGKQMGKIDIEMCHEYRKWRVARLTRPTSGDKTVDHDLATASNVLNYAVALGKLDLNKIRMGRPIFREGTEIQHAREFAPESGDELHRLATQLFRHRRSQVMGWLTLFSALTGCRTSELLRLRRDATKPEEPGYLSQVRTTEKVLSGDRLIVRPKTIDVLFIRRSKGGINPWILINPALAEMMEAFFAWHDDKFKGVNPWFFGGRAPGTRIHNDAFSRALPRAAQALGLPERHPHGLRSWYVTVRRGDGLSDGEVAAEIGDKTVELVSGTYGSIPGNWVGIVQPSLLPLSDPPAWAPWSNRPKIINLQAA